MELLRIILGHRYYSWINFIGVKMRRIKKLAFLTGLLAILTFSGTGYAASALYDFSGKPASINEFSGNGKWLVVMFWASDCHVCNVEAHQYKDFHFVHSDKDATVLGVSVDGMANKVLAEGFIKKHKLDFPNLIGEPEDVADLFTTLTGVLWRGTPTFLIYSPKGQLMIQQIGAAPTELIEEYMESQKKAGIGW